MSGVRWCGRTPRFGGRISAGERHASAAEHTRPIPTPDWALPERGRRGYDSDLVEALCERARHSYADLQVQRDDLLAQGERLSSELAQLRLEQPMVQEALVSAHTTARDVVAQAETEADARRVTARREAEEILDNARARARDVIAEADLDREEAENDVAQLQILARGIREEYRDFVDRALTMLDARGESGDTVAELQDTLVAAARNAPDA